MLTLTLICDFCKKSFIRLSKNHNAKHKHIFCNRKCLGLFKTKNGKRQVSCEQCSKTFIKVVGNCKGLYNFCSLSCSATYHNTHKTKGTRVSKLELFLQNSLQELYPNYDFHFNRKDAINSELDIYIPSLRLAFELNGIFHYEPIYGQEKLVQIKNNDNRKFQACLEKQIELCTIDTSSIKHFKNEKAKKFLQIISHIIELKLKTMAESIGIDPK